MNGDKVVSRCWFCDGGCRFSGFNVPESSPIRLLNSDGSRWDAYHKFKEDKKVMLLYHSDAILEIFPERWFPDKSTQKQTKRTLKQRLDFAGDPNLLSHIVARLKG